MRVFVGLGGNWPRRSCILIGLAFSIATSVAHARDPMPVSSVAGTLTVHLDQARIIRLPERTSTLVVGNPLIADVTVQLGGIVVITGKSYGATNLIALDRSGASLMQHAILVLGPRDPVVVVYRGIERESYSCAPICERRIMLGDTADSFTANLTQITTLNTQAQGGEKK